MMAVSSVSSVTRSRTWLNTKINSRSALGWKRSLLLSAIVLLELSAWTTLSHAVSLTGLLTALVHIIFWDHTLIGASGIVFMMIVLSSLVDLKGKEIPLTFILVVLLFIGQEVRGSFADDQVSQFAHITGGVLGAIFGFAYRSSSPYWPPLIPSYGFSGSRFS